MTRTALGKPAPPGCRSSLRSIGISARRRSRDLRPWRAIGYGGWGSRARLRRGSSGQGTRHVGTIDFDASRNCGAYVNGVLPSRHRRFRLLQPELHAHLAKHGRRRRKVVTSTLAVAGRLVEPPEAEVAVGDKVAHAQLLGAGQRV